MDSAITSSVDLDLAWILFPFFGIKGPSLGNPKQRIDFKAIVPYYDSVLEEFLEA